MARYETTSKDVLGADIVAIQDWEGFDSLARYLKTEHGARPIEQLDGPESRVWKFEIDGKVIALHNNPDGNYFKAIGQESQDVLKVVIENLERWLNGTEIANSIGDDVHRTPANQPCPRD
jgi:hypothetical protein